MTKEEINKILDRRQSHQSNEEDRIFLESWYNSQEMASDADYTIEERIEDSMLVWKSLVRQREKKRWIIWPRTAAAACIAIAVGLGTYYLVTRPVSVEDIEFSSTIKPGGNSAYLTLENGKRIFLDQAANGKLAEQSGASIIKTADGQLSYSFDAQPDPTGQKAGYNTVYTPNGGKYQVNLPDGTQVWLNAASSLKFPTSFQKSSTRVIELSGEAYFEVKKDSAHPFEVITAGEHIRVLGTHFNVNAYRDEPISKTTLLEGSISISIGKNTKTSIISPGQQAQNNAGVIMILPADIENAMDWKNDEFYFRDMDFAAAMRKIARWYDIEVVYAPGVDTSFSPGGWISRKSSISSVLKMMESTGNIHFKVDGRRVTVTK